MTVVILLLKSSQMLTQSGLTDDVFSSVKTKCVKVSFMYYPFKILIVCVCTCMCVGQVYSQMTQVFDNPEEVLMKFIQMATEKILLVRWTSLPFTTICVMISGTVVL